MAAEKDGGTSSPKKLIRHRLIQLFAVPPTVQQILPYVGHRDQTIVVFQRCNPGLTPVVGVTHVGHLQHYAFQSARDIYRCIDSNRPRQR